MRYDRARDDECPTGVRRGQWNSNDDAGDDDTRRHYDEAGKSVDTGNEHAWCGYDDARWHDGPAEQSNRGQQHELARSLTTIPNKLH